MLTPSRLRSLARPRPRWEPTEFTEMPSRSATSRRVQSIPWTRKTAIRCRSERCASASGRPGSNSGILDDPASATSCIAAGLNSMRCRRVRTRLLPTRYKYPTGFVIERRSLQCSQPYASASAVASRPRSRPTAATRAWRSSGSAMPKKSSNETSLVCMDVICVSPT